MKKELLQSLAEYIEERGVVTGEYIAEPGSYCAIGFLLSKIGHDDETIWGLESDQLVSYVISENEIETKPLFDAGFTTLELQTLQRANDEYDEHGESEETNELPKLIHALMNEQEIQNFSCYRWAKEATSHLLSPSEKGGTTS